MEKTNGITTWLKQNAWNLIVTTILIAMTWATTTSNAQADNRAQDKEIEVLKVKVNTYPSQEFFELRFSTIEKNQDELKLLIKEHINK